MKNVNGIVVIIVLYKTKPSDSSSLNQYLSYNHVLKVPKQLIIYNNSGDFDISEPKNCIIINSENNDMLAKPFNFAYEYAKNINYDWVLLIDADTNINKKYFEELNQFVKSGISENIASIVPQLFQNNKIISPHINKLFYTIRHPLKKNGFKSGNITAFNSLSMLRVSFIDAINGFNENYPLDMLDYWIYNQIFRLKKAIYILDCKIEHDLSVNDYDNKMSVERYINLIHAEDIFFKNAGCFNYLLFKIRLLYRAIKQRISLQNKRFSQITFKHIFR
ncbi:MAG: glycosyltransferase [Paludibacteraceae bacterium]|nr:glycosyltransferase [Paludibacteraceae bacterium]